MQNKNEFTPENGSPDATPESPRRRRGIYLLPNLFTTCGLFSGFYAIVAAMKGFFDTAAIAIFIAMIADSLDGRVARLTNTESAFGAEYDSLSDMAAFGVAPALVAYSWGLSSLGKIGWLIAFFYTAMAALRLARFNTQHDHADRRYFSGLPSPPAAGVVAGLVWMGNDWGFTGTQLSWCLAIFTIMAGGLMVSNLRYYSFKDLDLKGKVPFIALLSVVFILLGVSLDPPNILFLVFFIYALSGPVLWAMRFQKIKEGIVWVKNLPKNRKK